MLYFSDLSYCKYFNFINLTICVKGQAVVIDTADGDAFEFDNAVSDGIGYFGWWFCVKMIL